MLILGISPPAAPFSSLPGDLGYGDGFYIDPLSDPSPQAILSEHPHQRPSSLDLAVLADDDDHVLTVSDPSPQAAPLSGLHRVPPSADEHISTDCTLGAAGVRHLVAATSATPPPPLPPHHPPPGEASWLSVRESRGIKAARFGVEDYNRVPPAHDGRVVCVGLMMFHSA